MSVAVNGSPATTSCYGTDDRLVSSTDTSVGALIYDPRGNTTTLGNQTLTYDVADRHMKTEVFDATTLLKTVTYRRDAADRVVERTEATPGQALLTRRYGFTGTGDGASFVTDGLSGVVERQFSLLGGVLLTKRATDDVTRPFKNDVWSYPNIHGDVVAIAKEGAKVGPTMGYDPFGVAIGGVPDNSDANYGYGWLGQHQRPLEHVGGVATIEMGARQYVPSLGRFLEVDPVEGGCANDYTYVHGDPINTFDLTGELQSCNNAQSAGPAGIMTLRWIPGIKRYEFTSQLFPPFSTALIRPVSTCRCITNAAGSRRTTSRNGLVLTIYSTAVSTTGMARTEEEPSVGVKSCV